MALGLVCALVAPVPGALAPSSQGTSLEFRLWWTQDASCFPVPVQCAPSPGVDHAVSWEARACSDRLAALELVVVPSSGAPVTEVRLLNGPPGLPGSTGPCFHGEGTWSSLLQTCATGIATLTPEGGGPIVAYQVACGGAAGPLHHNLDLDFHELPA